MHQIIFKITQSVNIALSRWQGILQAPRALIYHKVRSSSQKQIWVFIECLVTTNDAIKHISSVVKGVSRLKKEQEAVLKQFCQLIFERAEKGDVEAQVVLGKFTSD